MRAFLFMTHAEDTNQDFRMIFAGDRAEAEEKILHGDARLVSWLQEFYSSWGAPKESFRKIFPLVFTKEVGPDFSLEKLTLMKLRDSRELETGGWLNLAGSRPVPETSGR